EPLSGRVNPIAGATFEAVLMGGEQDLILLASDAGYGFVAKLGDLQGRNKAGKAVLKLPSGAKVLPPQRVFDYAQERIAAVTNDGRLLLFPISELPQLAKGKGNKIVGIPASKASNREEYVVALAVLSANQGLVLYAGKRHLTLKPADLEHYLGERGRRGSKLPRGFQRVEAVEPEIK
ncbi:MAG TPA: DNA gyrase C-terminal beta-propeller domain-containing protein, partial [Gammaproteobacteria bacterium]